MINDNIRMRVEVNGEWYELSIVDGRDTVVSKVGVVMKNTPTVELLDMVYKSIRRDVCHRFGVRGGW